MGTRRWAWVAAVVMASWPVATAAWGTTNTGAATRAATPSSAAPCVGMAGTPAYRHIVIIMDENVGYSTLMSSSQAPYLHQLATTCGSEALMHGASHPSQVNYMAATSGVASGVATRTSNDNVFHQATVNGDTWRGYNESMPKACVGNSGVYKAGHNPAFWYDDLRKPTNTCALYDIPMAPALDNDIAADQLPTLAWITPNACNDMHGLTGCPHPSSQRIADGDAWLGSLIPRLTAMPSYVAGQTLIIVTWDEGDGAEINGSDCTLPSVYTTQKSCQIATFVVSPYVAPGAVDHADHNLYGMLGDVEDILGYPRLGRAVGQPSLRPGLGF
jgi:phosphatidylinositol-3-phosphatase